jgi:hypothetical protein
MNFINTFIELKEATLACKDAQLKHAGAPQVR